MIIISSVIIKAKNLKYRCEILQNQWKQNLKLIQVNFPGYIINKNHALSVALVIVNIYYLPENYYINL